jgi:hypothetical protein
MGKLLKVMVVLASIRSVCQTSAPSRASQSSSHSKVSATGRRKHVKPGKVKVPSSPGTQPCPIRTGKQNRLCVLPLSWLKSQESTGHLPIEVFHKDRIIWVGDDGELLVVNQLTRADCKDERTPISPDSTDMDPTDVDTDVLANAISAVVTMNQSNEGKCYKHNIIVYDENGTKTGKVDPHIIIDPGNPFQLPYNLLLEKHYDYK